MSEVKTREQLEIRLVQLNSSLMHLDDTLAVLTEATAETGDLQWKSTYLKNEPRLNDILQELVDVCGGSQILDGVSAQKAAGTHKQIDAINARVFSLVEQGRQQEAKALLASEQYKQLRNDYSKARDAFELSLNRHVEHEFMRHHSQMLRLLAISMSVAFIMLLVWVSCLLLVRNARQRHAADLAIRRSERRFRALVENADDTIAIVDKDGVLHFINRVGATVLGLVVEECVGKTVWELLPREAAERCMSLVTEAMDSGGRVRKEMMAELNGECQWFDAIAAPKAGEDIGSRRVMIIARDIRESKQAARRLETFHRQMARAEQLASLGTFSATLAHDLKVFLQVVFSGIENAIAELEGSNAEAAQEDLRDALSGACRIQEMLKEFRAMASEPGEAGPCAADVGKVAAKVAGLLEHKATGTNVAIELHKMEGLGEVCCDTHKLEQVFYSLLENSLQEADGRTAHRIVVSGDMKDGHVEVSVSDDCGGISTEHADRVFEPFFSTGPQTERTGLGLYISKQIIEDAKGTIRLETAEGEGATFVITLPAADSDGH